MPVERKVLLFSDALLSTCVFLIKLFPDYNSNSQETVVCIYFRNF